MASYSRPQLKVLSVLLLLPFTGCGESAPAPTAVTPDVAAPVAVEPVSPPVVAVTIEDSDSDGVRDGRDQCANTPAGRNVGADGCEYDEDDDGVVTALDRCPDTPDDVSVDADGCPQLTRAERFTPEIVFEPNSTVLDLAGISKKLLPVRERIELYPEAVVTVAGYTDNSGNTDLNRRLSMRRAQAVVDYLVEDGEDPARFVVDGRGEADPVADNATERGRARNRRIEITLTPAE